MLSKAGSSFCFGMVLENRTDREDLWANRLGHNAGINSKTRHKTIDRRQTGFVLFIRVNVGIFQNFHKLVEAVHCEKLLQF